MAEQFYQVLRGNTQQTARHITACQDRPWWGLGRIYLLYTSF